MDLVKNFFVTSKITTDESTKSQVYCKFIISPYRSGFGHTIGHSLRRVLLSSIGGLSIYAIKIDDVTNEFSLIPGVVEDVSEVILNIKKIILSNNRDDDYNFDKKFIISIDKKNAIGTITANDINTNSKDIVIVNPDLKICTLHKKMDFSITMYVRYGIGYIYSEKNRIFCTKNHQEKNIIPIDSLFNSVKRVNYHVGMARLGGDTEMDSLTLEIWTDGRIDPESAIKHSAMILSKHLIPFFDVNKLNNPDLIIDNDERDLFQMLRKSVDILDLSVRSQNCLNLAGIKLMSELCVTSENRMLKFKNFGKKSLNEIISKLKKLNLSLGMSISASILKAIDLEKNKE